MIGYCYGYNHTVYAMAGITNWGYTDLYYEEPTFQQDVICAKIKVGGNLFISRHLFVNLDLSYLFPKRMSDYCLTYKGFNLQGGIGFRF